jgi:hypothetical protein
MLNECNRGMAMNNRIKILVGAIAIGLPALIFFQNCAPKAQMVEAIDVSSSSKAAPIDSNDLPLNQEFEVDENNNQKYSTHSSPSEDGEVRYGVEDREQERQRDIEEALADCQALALNESQNQSGEVSQDPINIKNIRGSKVLSPADFGGAKEINKISNAYGKIVLCDLKVNLIEQSGGKLILIGSEVQKISSHHGTVDLVEGSAVIDASNVKIYRASLEGEP